MMLTVNKYVMPHLLNRFGQEDAFLAIQEWYQSDKQFMILSAPTGIGKTALIAQMCAYVRVLALARTKVLLDTVYENEYGFKKLEGKGNHPCLVSPKTHNADVCAIPESATRDERFELCRGTGECSYYVQEDEFMGSFMGVTTYAKYLSDQRVSNRPDMMSFDEAHELPELVIERAGLNIDTTKGFLRGFQQLYDIPFLDFDSSLNFMRSMYATAIKNTPAYNRENATEQDYIKYKRQVIRHKLFLDRIEETAKLMKMSEDEGKNFWHYSTTSEGMFSARPMTAKYHFKSIMNVGNKKTLLMSATIDEMICDFLGIEKDEYMFYEAPQQFPVQWRKIYDLGQPGMGHKQTKKKPSLYNVQAVRISNILKLRPDVSSVVLTTSKAKCRNLAQKLEEMGHDVFVPPIGMGTDFQLRAWEAYRKPGAVCVSYNFWEGVSLDADHMLFIAGIKFPDLSSYFEQARRDRSITQFLYRGAIFLVQGTGRIQRGFRGDYLPLGVKLVFIVDGNYKRVQKFAPGDFMERIEPWNGQHTYV